MLLSFSKIAGPADVAWLFLKVVSDILMILFEVRLLLSESFTLLKFIAPPLLLVAKLSWKCEL